MTLLDELSGFITSVGTDWKNLWAKIGTGALDTTATNLTAAVNEVKATADAAVSGTAPDASETVKGIVELATGAETITGTDGTRAVTPAGLDSALDSRIVAATASAAGIVELASDAEALALSATDRAVTPGNLGAIRGVANGLAGLDGSGKVPSAQLPSFVDDVVEAANFAALPGTGETGKIYTTLDTNNAYRWSGSAYVEIAASPGTTDEVTEGSTNLYFTNARADNRADGRITALVGDTNTDLVALYTAAKA